MIDDPVFLRALGSEPAIAVRVALHLFDGLPGVFGDQRLKQLLGLGHLFSLNGDIGGLTLNAAQRLMHHDASVR